MNNIITFENNTPTKKAEAEFLHYEILRNGNDAAEAMCSLAMNLKKMRDERLYEELGFDSFENYTEKAVGLKKSQAYDYIKALETLGEDVFRSTGRLGITKVKTLCAFSPAQAEQFVNENNVDEMTVRELKAKVKELTKKGEQLSLDLDNAKSSNDEELQKLRDEIYDLEVANEHLEKENEELKNKPTEVAIREPSEAEITSISKKAVDEATKDYEKKLKDAETAKKTAEKMLSDSEAKHAEELKKAKKEALKAAREEASKENSQLADEITKVKQHSAELEKQLKLSASPEITRFSFYFEAVQNDVNKLLEALSKIEDANTVKKLKENLCHFADNMKGTFEK
jgi:DNA repair exonuclease SbcCD ATPase subunit